MASLLTRGQTALIERQQVAAVSLGTAGVARRLDSCVADDLGRTLAAAK